MKIKVLIVDDSAVIRSLLQHFISSEPDMEVVGTAPDPYVARQLLVDLKPDVMTLDIEMPRMDGVTFLEKVMQHFPIRTVIVSSLSTKGSQLSLRALEAGAIDVIEKPAIDVKKGMDELRAQLVQRVRVASKAHLVPRLKIKPPTSVPNSISGNSRTALEKTTHQILAIAASTGGTEALKAVLTEMPHDIPGTVIVQHMPPVFTAQFARTLSSVCRFEVREAKDGDRVIPGLALLAPGNFHMELHRSGAYYYVKLNQEAPEHSVRPAADVLFRSVAKYAGANAVGLVLTGMGKDGAAGLLAMKNAGATTYCQDEKSSVVWGMPKAAYEIGAVKEMLPLGKIAGALITELKKRDVAAA
ncbi:MAG: chemotaxis response regulator protein-glutamate methylesterase [Bdellovibrionaceae bacterium]|nr:chemotaxis response regulator protein-glutamate methylesterase [Pseudobdellovibrionaceae bacterium]